MTFVRSKRQHLALRAGAPIRHTAWVITHAPMPTSLFVAIVHRPETVELIAVSSHQDAVLCRLAQYVYERAAHTLWERDAVRVETLLASDDKQAAIDHYFATVGQRWDKEWLVTKQALVS